MRRFVKDPQTAWVVIGCLIAAIIGIALGWQRLPAPLRPAHPSQGLLRDLREWWYWNLYGPVKWRVVDLLNRWPSHQEWLGRHRYGAPVTVIEGDYDLVWYDRALTPDERQQANDWLAEKWLP